MILDTTKPKIGEAFWINDGDNSVCVTAIDGNLFAEIYAGDSHGAILECLALNSNKSYGEQGFKIWMPDTIYFDDKLLS